MTVESTTLLEEEEAEIPVVQQSTKMETDEASSAAAPPSASENDVNMQDAKSADAPGTENGAQGDIPDQMETDAKVRTNRFGMFYISVSCEPVNLLWYFLIF